MMGISYTGSDFIGEINEMAFKIFNYDNGNSFLLVIPTSGRSSLRYEGDCINGFRFSHYIKLYLGHKKCRVKTRPVVTCQLYVR